MQEQLPPGPRMPSLWQTIGFWTRPTAFLEQCRGATAAVHRSTAGPPPFVMIADPEQIKEMFVAPPDVLHPGEGARILEPIVGRHSVILLDEEPHLEQRKLLLPAFHGESMQRLAGVMAELAEAEVASWPRDETVALHPRLQRLTLEIVLQTVFGLRGGPRLDRLRELLTEILAFGESPLSVIPASRERCAARGPWARLERASEQADALMYALIDERRAEGAHGDDVLSLLLGARHGDGTPMAPSRDPRRADDRTGRRARDDRLAAGVGLRATGARAARVLARLAAELDDGESEEYLTATIHEIMRCQPGAPQCRAATVVKPDRGRRRSPTRPAWC